MAASDSFARIKTTNKVGHKFKEHPKPERFAREGLVRLLKGLKKPFVLYIVFLLLLYTIYKPRMAASDSFAKIETTNKVGHKFWRHPLLL